VSEPSLQKLICTLLLRMRMSVTPGTITRAFETAIATPWKLSVPQSMTLGRLCTAVAVPTVRCDPSKASFVVDGKGYLKCSPKDRILLT